MRGWKELFRLGLKEYQARCLACLVKNGDLTAQKISKEAEVPYPKVYSTLKELENMNLLISTNERPKKYIAKEKDRAINFLIDKKRREFERIREQGRRARQKLKSKKAVDFNNSIYIQKTLTNENI
ncbi:MAG: TrmB family transcriptional regulator [archaeon]